MTSVTSTDRLGSKILFGTDAMCPVCSPTGIKHGEWRIRYEAMFIFKAYRHISFKRTQDAFVGDPAESLRGGDGVYGGGEGIRLRHDIW